MILGNFSSILIDSYNYFLELAPCGYFLVCPLLELGSGLQVLQNFSICPKLSQKNITGENDLKNEFQEASNSLKKGCRLRN